MWIMRRWMAIAIVWWWWWWVVATAICTRSRRRPRWRPRRPRRSGRARWRVMPRIGVVTVTLVAVTLVAVTLITVTLVTVTLIRIIESVRVCSGLVPLVPLVRSKLIGVIA